MSTVKVTLNDGLTIGENTYKEASLRLPTAGDLIDATEEAEKLIATPDGGYQLMASPTLVGLHTLRRQVVSIGEHPGPLTLNELRRLSAIDIAMLQSHAELLESSTLMETADRGRDSEAPV